MTDVLRDFFREDLRRNIVFLAIDALIGSLTELASVGVRIEARPLLFLGYAELLAKVLHLGVVQQRRVIQRIAEERHLPALDRISEDDGGSRIGSQSFVKHVDHVLQVVPTEVRDQIWQYLVGHILQRPRDIGIELRITMGDALP